MKASKRALDQISWPWVMPFASFRLGCLSGQTTKEPLVTTPGWVTLSGRRGRPALHRKTTGNRSRAGSPRERCIVAGCQDAGSQVLLLFHLGSFFGLPGSLYQSGSKHLSFWRRRHRSAQNALEGEVGPINRLGGIIVLLNDSAFDGGTGKCPL